MPLSHRLKVAASFGLVKELSVDGEAQLTGVSTLLGTPQYMAPEAILEANAADARSDIYALGAVAYYLLAGADVFEGKSIIELCIQHIHHAPDRDRHGRRGNRRLARAPSRLRRPWARLSLRGKYR